MRPVSGCSTISSSAARSSGDAPARSAPPSRGARGAGRGASCRGERTEEETARNVGVCGIDDLRDKGRGAVATRAQDFGRRASGAEREREKEREWGGGGIGGTLKSGLDESAIPSRIVSERMISE